MIQYKGQVQVSTSSNTSSSGATTSVATSNNTNQIKTFQMPQQVLNLQNIQNIQNLQSLQNMNMSNIQQIPQQFIQGGQLIQNPGTSAGNMFQVVQPLQTVNVDGQEVIFIPNMAAANNQLVGAQQMQINSLGQVIRQPTVSGLQTQFIPGLGQAVQIPTSTATGTSEQAGYLTIPGTNIQIPINMANQTQTLIQPKPEVCGAQQGAQAQESAANQAQTTQQPGQAQGHPQPTVTIPGTNIQIPSNVATANNILGNFNGEFFFFSFLDFFINVLTLHP